MYEAIEELASIGVKIVILGCTEIPLIIDKRDYGGSCILIDTGEILANRAIDVALTVEKMRLKEQKKDKKHFF